MSNLRIDKLRREHNTSAFHCGEDSLDRFLDRFAFPNQQAGGSTSYVALSENQVVGFYSLAVGQVVYEDAPERLSKGLARHPVPVMLLARLAVDLNWQGKRLGAGLLRDALLRTLQAADIVGIRPLSFTPKTMKPGVSMNTLDFSLPPRTPITCSDFSKISAQCLETSQHGTAHRLHLEGGEAVARSLGGATGVAIVARAVVDR